MIVWTNRREYAEKLFGEGREWKADKSDPASSASIVRDVAEYLFYGKPCFKTAVPGEFGWKHAFAVERAPESHFDILVELSRKGLTLPSGLICLAGSSLSFHGQHGRAWEAVEGNIHLTAFLAPCRRVESFGAAFQVLAAVSVLETIDDIDSLSGRAGVKWVNDILIGRGKVAGFLVQTQTMEDVVSTLVLGIGLNVDKTPRIKPDPFAPAATSLRSFVKTKGSFSQRSVLESLLRHLWKNYELVLEGRSAELLETYRRRSVVVGRRVSVISETLHGKKREIISGRIRSIGDNLELHFEGLDRTISQGRLIIKG